MKTILFDQFQRYNNVKQIVDSLRNEGRVLRILEVGANEHRNLEVFLPTDEITYLDIKLPDGLLSDPQFILGDATQMDFPDNHFDIIVALDVYEHIPGELRKKFIDELYRVSSSLFILTAPFHSKHVVEAESRVNSVFKSFFNEDFIWLAEHIEFGLPKIEQLTEYLEEKKMNFEVLSHGSVDLWERIMTIHFFAASNPKLSFMREEIDKYYNTYLFSYDYSDNSYRKIVVVNKVNMSLERNHLSKIPIDYLNEFNRLEDLFFRLASIVNIDEHLPNINNNINEDKIQIFIDYGEGFAENCSRTFLYGESSTKYISLDFTGIEENVYRIRIDPSDYSGCFILENMKLILENGEKSPNHYEGNFIFNYEDIYLFDEDDPQIGINMPLEKLTGIQFEIRKVSYRVLIDKIIRVIQEITQMNDVASETANNLQNKVSEMDSLNQSLQKENDILISEIEDIKVNNELLIIEKNNAISLLELREKEVEELRSRVYCLESELEAIYSSRAWNAIRNIKKIFKK